MFWDLENAVTSSPAQSDLIRSVLTIGDAAHLAGLADLIYRLKIGGAGG